MIWHTHCSLHIAQACSQPCCQPLRHSSRCSGLGLGLRARACHHNCAASLACMAARGLTAPLTVLCLTACPAADVLNLLGRACDAAAAAAAATAAAAEFDGPSICACPAADLGGAPEAVKPAALPPSAALPPASAELVQQPVQATPQAASKCLLPQPDPQKTVHYAANHDGWQVGRRDLSGMQLCAVP